MRLERQHNDLDVTLTRNREGRIIKADLIQDGGPLPDDHLQLTPDQLYALVDDVAVADPERWESRFPTEADTEVVLRRVADYFRERAQVNRDRGLNLGADIFDLAVTRVMEEIEGLYPTVPDEVADPVQYMNDYHQRS